MKTIPLSQGKFAIVDDEDFPLVSEFKWCFRADQDRTCGYAVRHVKVDGKDKLMYLHRQIMPPAEGQEVIFLNHDKLDCRRSNLKAVSSQEAKRHHRVRKDSKTGIKGVRYNPESDSWSAYVYRNGRYSQVGTYKSEASAKTAYESAMTKENPDLHKAPEPVQRGPDQNAA